MQPYAHFSVSETEVCRDRLLLPGTIALTLWLPLVVFGATLWIAQHDLAYASPFFSDDESIDLTATPARQVSFVALGACGAMLLLRCSHVRLSMSMGQLIGLISLCLLLVLSAFWSDHLELSLKRALIPLLTVVAALGVVKHWQPYQACWFVCFLTSIFLLLGIGAELASGKFLSGGDYRFAGTLHPNSQAVNCAMLSLASLALYRDPRQRASRLSSLLCLGLFGVGTCFLLLSKSRTGTAAYLLALLFFFTMAMPRRKKLLVVACLAMISITGVLSVLAFDSAGRADSLFIEAAKMGRDQDSDDVSSLTGRIPIWQGILRDVASRPSFGHGYGAFWTPEQVVQYSYIHDWEFTHAHSAYLETLLNVGIVGLALGLLFVVAVIRSAGRAYRATDDCGYRFAGAMLVMALVHGFLDSNFVVVGQEPALALICISVVVLHGGRRAANDATPLTHGEGAR